MASIIEIYIQLGFEPADQHWKVPDPATQAKYHHYKYQACDDSLLKKLRSHAKLLDLLEEVREFIDHSVTAPMKLAVDQASIEETPIPEVSQMTNNFLNLSDRATRYWGNAVGEQNNTHGPQWPRDKQL